MVLKQQHLLEKVTTGFASGLVILFQKKQLKILYLTKIYGIFSS